MNALLLKRVENPSLRGLDECGRKILRRNRA
jgi:hypothetical protein